MDSARAFGANLLASVHDRIELLSVELQEEKFRLLELFVWISVGVFAGVMAATFVTLTLVYLFWETARIAVLATFALLYSGTAIWVARAIRDALRRQPRPLEATLGELTADQSCLRANS